MYHPNFQYGSQTLKAKSSLLRSESPGQYRSGPLFSSERMIFITMIKLKSLLAEGLDVTPYLHPDGRFDWTKFLNSNKTDDNYHLDPGAAKALISSDFREKLDPGLVYHIILTAPKENREELFDFATHYLTPDQLSQIRFWDVCSNKQKMIGSTPMIPARRGSISRGERQNLKFCSNKKHISYFVGQKLGFLNERLC